MKEHKKAIKRHKVRSKKAEASDHTEGLKKLSDTEAKALAEFEKTIGDGLAGYVEVGLALMQIDDKQLYKAMTNIFSDYCRQRWNITDRYAYRLIKAAKCTLVLKGEFTSRGAILPINEAQIRPLCDAYNKASEWIKAWKKVIKDTHGEGITGERVEEIIRSMTGKPAKKGNLGKPAEKSIPNKMLSKVMIVIDKALRRKSKSANVQYFRQILEQIRELIRDRTLAAQSS